MHKVTALLSLPGIAALSACVDATARTDQGQTAQRFEIAAETVPCTGVMLQRCLVVNGTYFYDRIEGYSHTEGQAAVIHVARSQRAGPLPADASAYVYRMVTGTDDGSAGKQP